MDYVLIPNYQCKRCGCTKYDKIIHTGAQTLDEKGAIKAEKYVCRNCDYPFDINDYQQDNKISMSPNELLAQSKFVNEGIKYNKGDE